MNDTVRYAKVVRWSEEDGCYVGTSPGLIHGGVHGSDERKVFDELCRVVEEAVALYQAEGRPLPPPTSAGDIAKELQEDGLQIPAPSNF